MLVVSDIHFGARKTDRGPLIAGITALARRTSERTVIFAGDFTQHARSSEFASAGRLIRALLADGINVVATPGNHDYGRWLGEKLTNRAARERYRREIFDPVAAQLIVRAVRDVDLVAEIGSHVFIAIRSTHAWWRRAGRIRKAQIAWAVEAVRPLLAEGRRVHLVTHRALWRDLPIEHGPMRYIDRLVDGLLAPLNVATVIAGHNHLAKSGLRSVGTCRWPIFQIACPTLSKERERGGSDAGVLDWDLENSSSPRFICLADVLACARST
jgi:3',5'-cyclic AMP phosphodiesterase CpdA